MLAIGEKHFIEPAGPRAEGEEDPFPMKFNFFFHSFVLVILYKLFVAPILSFSLSNHSNIFPLYLT